MPTDRPQSLLDELRDRRFSFFPAIRGIEHNEWTLLDATWSEVQVRNGESGREFWIPRSHLGELSSTDSPVAILGLRRELESKAGGIYPYRSVVLEIPSTPASRLARPIPAPPPPKRVISGSDARTLRLLGIAIGAALVLVVFGFLAVVGGLHNPLDVLFRKDVSTLDQRYLGLASHSSYFEVVGRLGQAESEEWISDEEDELQFQLLRYPARNYLVVMMGGTRADMRYLGTLHTPSKQILDSARLARGGDTAPMLRNLPDF